MVPLIGKGLWSSLKLRDGPKRISLAMASGLSWLWSGGCSIQCFHHVALPSWLPAAKLLIFMYSVTCMAHLCIHFPWNVRALFVDQHM